MLRELKQVIQGEVSHNIGFQKKIQKSSSASEVTLSHIRRTQRLSQVGDDLPLQSPIDRSQHSKQSNQFIFCLKLKMIGIARLFENSQLDSQKIQSKDANLILSDLVKKIKNYQKENSRKLNQEQNKNKKLEIQIISLNSKVKTLQSDISHLKRQQDKLSKINTNDLKKLESKIKQNDKQKQIIQLRLRSTSQLADEQTKVISQLQNKLSQLSKNKKVIQGSIFDKEKQIIQLVNEQKFQKLKFIQQCQGLKKSLMKKTEEINKLSDEVKSLKQIIDNKQFKIDQLRKKYNKTYGELEKSQCRLNTLQDQFQKSKQHNDKLDHNLNIFIQKQQKTNSQINQFQLKIASALQSLQPFIQQMKNMKKYQENVILQIDFLAQRMDQLFKNLENQYIAQQELLRQQFRIQIRNVIADMQIYYQRLLGNLQDELFNMRCKLKKENIASF